MIGDAKIYAVIAEMEFAQIELLLQAYGISVNPFETADDLRVVVRVAYEQNEIRAFDILAAADYAS